MNLKNLFVMQKKLDEYIINQHNLRDKPLLPQKLLALQVEIAELANETRCFKYWSTKGPSSKDVILEEYVDCLHFILTIGLEKNYTDVSLTIPDVSLQADITDKFTNLYIDVNDFIICPSKDHYQTLFEDFLLLGKYLKFTDEDIEKGYHKKNFINYQRQVIGY